MNGQMAAIISDLESASRRLRELRQTLPEAAWSERPGPGRWSPAECIAHLNLTSAAVLPCVREALRAARTCREPVGSRYRLDAMGWLLDKVVSPESRLKLVTPMAFAPEGCETVDCLVARFEALQIELIAVAREAEGLPIDSVRVVSPFDPRIKTNLYAALMLVGRHQHRHLLQAAHAAETAIAVSAVSFAPA
jgi:hypothetical protein